MLMQSSSSRWWPFGWSGSDYDPFSHHLLIIWSPEGEDRNKRSCCCWWLAQHSAPPHQISWRISAAANLKVIWTHKMIMDYERDRHFFIFQMKLSLSKWSRWCVTRNENNEKFMKKQKEKQFSLMQTSDLRFFSLFIAVHHQPHDLPVKKHHGIRINSYSRFSSPWLDD